MKYFRFSNLLILVTLIMLISCSDDPASDDGPEGTPEGTFTITIDGDINNEFSGNAFFGSATDPESGASGFVVTMSSGGEQDTGGNLGWLIRIGETRPGTGTYSLSNVEDFEDESWNPDDFFSVVFSDNIVFGSISGSVQITSSSANNVAGSFEYSSVGMTPDGTELSVTVSADFNAITGNVFLPGF